MSVGVVFAVIVLVLLHGLVRSQFFKPCFEIGMKAGFIIVDENRIRNVHCVSSTNPSLMRLSLRHSSICGVILLKALRLGILNHSYLR